MLALAHHIQRQIDDGAVPDYASAASALGVTRARLSQVMSLLLLAPDIQARIAMGKLILTERTLRRVVGEPEWEEQLAIVQQITEEVSSCPILHSS